MQHGRPSLAEELVDELAALEELDRRPAPVLEPSAGTGRLVQAVLAHPDAARVHVTAIESNAHRARQLPNNNQVTTLVEPFEIFADRTTERFDRIVMNPPFSVPGHAALWVDHLLRAWNLLAPGGRLLAIVPARVLESDSRGAIRKAHELFRLHGEGRRLPARAFAESGTAVGAAVITLDRIPTAAEHAPPPADHPSIFRTYSGDEPIVDVRRPYLSRAAALTLPVQRFATFVGPRVLRYRADCIVCPRAVWGFDDLDDDARGPVGLNSAAWALRPDHFEGWSGPIIGLCVGCADDRETAELGLRRAQEVWTHGAPPASAGQLSLDVM